MVKQNIALLNADRRTIRCHKSAKEIQRMLDRREVDVIREKGKPVRYALKPPPPEPSFSRESACQLTMFDMTMLASMDDVQIKRIARAAQESNPEPWVVAKLKLVQRWMGHGLIEASPAVELIAQV